MKRTTIMLPAKLRAQSMRRAREEGISLGELIRRALADRVAARNARLKDDPFWADKAVYRGPGPKDAVANLDRYVYDFDDDGNERR